MSPFLNRGVVLGEPRIRFITSGVEIRCLEVSPEPRDSEAGAIGGGRLVGQGLVEGYWEVGMG